MSDRVATDAAPSRARVTAVGAIVVITSDLGRFRTFYEGLLGLPHVISLRMDHPPFAVHGVFAVGGHTVLHAFETPGYDPSADGIGTQTGRRGRLDHFTLLVADEPALIDVRDRLVAGGASDGEVTTVGPYLSVSFRDPDGLEGAITCPDRGFDPSRTDDEVVECTAAPTWTSELLAGAGSADDPDT